MTDNSTVLIHSRSSALTGTMPYPWVCPDHPVTYTFRSTRDCEEDTLGTFFSTLWNKRHIVLRDVRKNTPQLIILGSVLGAIVVGYIVGWTFDKAFLHMKWEHLYDKFEDATADVEAYIDSAYDLQDAIAVVEEAKLFTFNASNVNTTINSTYAREQIDFYLQQLGYEVTLSDMQELSSAVANLTATAQTTSLYFNDLAEGYNDFKSRVRGYKDEYNDLKWSWNSAVIVSSIIASLTSAASILWPILVASNTRHNLRTGKWRLNKQDYCVNYKLHILTEVPGMIFGVTAVSHIVLFLVLAVVLFTLFYWPLREFIWDTFKKYIVSLFCAIVFKNLLVYLLFDKWQLDKMGSIKDLKTYSVVFMIILFFNVVYGALAGAIRLLVFFAYSFVANLRIDTTVLPIPLWKMDSAFSAYNAYLLYEHEHKNPIMRTALEILAGSYSYSFACPPKGMDAHPLRTSAQKRARTRWFLAYTLLCNPALIQLRRKGHPVGDDGNECQEQRAVEEEDPNRVVNDLESGAVPDAGIRGSEVAGEGIVMSELHRH